ncbi:DUF111 family protein [Eggerthellaceae bacterium zg-893]|nr:DUF111 family protein [Eggerthellaceae bacterium zg-893]
MSKLVWTLEENATRKHLLDETLVQISREERKAVLADVEKAKVPHRHHNSLAEIDATIDGLDVTDWVKEQMKTIYGYLVEAEAEAHQTTTEEAHFHEVGNWEAIENVLAICLGVAAANRDNIVATPVQVGEGQIECAHGILDVPTPATAAIIARGIPVQKKKLPGERCTPTAAAVILNFVDEWDDNALGL